MIKQHTKFDNDYNIIEYWETNKRGRTIYKETIKNYKTPAGIIHLVTVPEKLMKYVDFTPVKTKGGNYYGAKHKALEYILKHDSIPA